MRNLEQYGIDIILSNILAGDEHSAGALSGLRYITAVAEIPGTLLTCFWSACKLRLVMGVFLCSRLVATINSEKEKVGKNKKERQLKTAMAISWRPICCLLHTGQKQNDFPGNDFPEKIAVGYCCFKRR